MQHAHIENPKTIERKAWLALIGGMLFGAVILAAVILAV